MKLRGFFRDRRGVAALEFALLSTFVLLPLFLGLVEILTMLRAESKLTALTVDVAQMVSYEAQGATGITLLPTTAAGSTSMQDICQGAITALYPFPAGTVILSIASVTVETNKNGLSSGTGNAPVYSASPTYDVWETDFKVTGSTCTTTSGTGAGMSNTNIGTANAELLATTSPPSTTGTTGYSGMLAVPCDNAIIVKASMTYPGIIGVVLRTRPVLSQTSFARWANSWTEAELQCTGTGCATNYAATQICNATNTLAIN